MRVSTRTSYGLRALLVLASRYGEGSLPVSQIARKEGLSVPYLEQILNGLQSVQNIVSTRTTLPILSNVLVRAEEKLVALTRAAPAGGPRPTGDP